MTIDHRARSARNTFAGDPIDRAHASVSPLRLTVDASTDVRALAIAGGSPARLYAGLAGGSVCSTDLP